MERFLVPRDSHSRPRQGSQSDNFCKWPEYELEIDEVPAGLRLLIENRNNSSLTLSPSPSSPTLLIRPSETVRKHSPYLTSSKGLSVVYGGNGSPIQLNNNRTSPEPETRWSITWRVLVGYIKEDYYRTYLAACDCWSLYPKSEDRRLKMRLMMDEVFIFSYNHIEMRSKQTFNCEIWPPESPRCVEPTSICVSSSFLTVTGDVKGNINVYDAARQCLITSSTLDRLTTQLYTSTSNRKQAEKHAFPTHLTWFPRLQATCDDVLMIHGLASEFILGDSLGRVFVVGLTNSLDLSILCFPLNPDEDCKETVCGMSLSSDGALLSVSTFDSNVSVWRLGDEKELKCLCRIEHPCVIRGLSFCPGINRILATGGGRTDRCLRLIDVYSVTVLKTVTMPAQIVGIVWVSRCEIFVALGHSRVNGYRGYGKVYNILTDKIVADIPATAYALTAIKTMTGFCINTSKNEMIQFDWAEDPKTVCTTQSILGAFGLARTIPVLR